MTKKDVCIIGVDVFTQKIAENLKKAGSKVVLIDNDQEKVDALSAKFEYVYKADATNKTSLEEVNINEFDKVIIGVSTMEDSIIIVSNLKELNVKNIIAKVRNDVQKRVLSILTDGNIKIIWPEEIISGLVSFRLIHNIDINLSMFDKDVSIIKIPVLNSKLFQMEIKDFDTKNQYLTNIIMIDRGYEVIFPVKSTTKLLNGDVITIACKSDSVNQIVSLFSK
ncbi:TrkA family potassium uptake protein [bacterium]|nr:TrkA family potassium uptake protein [bacterium]